MAEFRFSELSRLYLKEIEVVRAAEKSYYDEADRFFGMVIERIGVIVSPESFNSKRTGTFYYWWLGKDSWEDAYLYVGHHNPDYLDHTGLVVCGATNRKSDENAFNGVRSLLNNRRLALEAPERQSKDCIFSLSVNFANDDVVEETAQRVALVLVEMHKAISTILGNGFTPG